MIDCNGVGMELSLGLSSVIRAFHAVWSSIVLQYSLHCPRKPHFFLFCPPEYPNCYFILLGSLPCYIDI